MEKSLFYVGERPCAVWDPEIRKKNLELLKHFDTHYFEYMANIHSAEVDSEHTQQAATALRTSYGLALETLFSLLGATLQAPKCVFGWLYQYKEGDLRLVVQGISGTRKLRTRFRGQLTWKSLSNTIHRNLLLSDKVKEGEIKAGFATFWDYSATEYLDLGSRSEFNSMKHGLRFQPGGFRLAFGLQEKRDVPAPPNRMEGMGGSKFGATTLTLERIGKTRLDYRVREHSRNWDLGSLAGRIRLISMSIHNVVSCLLILNGQEPSKLQFFSPEDLADFDRAWESNCGTNACSIGSCITEENICLTTADEVEKSYNFKDKDSA